MSQYSKLILWATIAVAVAYIGFFLLMTDGFTLGVRSPTFMGFSVCGFLTTVAAVVLCQQLMIKPTERSRPDEREEFVDARSEQLGGRILEAGVFAVVALAIYEAAAGPGSLGSYSLARPEAIVFAMITISAFAAVARMILAIIQDQRL